MAEQPTGYSILAYGRMVTIEPRIGAYARALRAAITPGCTVFDIGAGPGVLSLLACTYGAGSVVAIEPDDSIEILAELAQANGFSDRIRIFKGLSTDFRPETPADVIVSDLRSSAPLFERHIPTIVDARQRLLAPGGSLIPSRDIMRLAVAEAPDVRQPYDEPWLVNGLGLDLSAAHRFAVNSFSRVDLLPPQLLAPAQDWATLDYHLIEEPNVTNGFDFTIEREGTAHGLALWFDAELADGIGFSNAPGEPPQIYGQRLYPFEQPVDVVPGDRITGEITAALINSKYVWSWRSSFWRAGAKRGIEFEQSSFLAQPVPRDQLLQRESGFAPPASPLHQVDLHCLSLIDGRMTLGEVAEQVAQRHPEVFPSSSEALNHVARLAARYR